MGGLSFGEFAGRGTKTGAVCLSLVYTNLPPSVVTKLVSDWILLGSVPSCWSSFTQNKVRLPDASTEK